MNVIWDFLGLHANWLMAIATFAMWVGAFGYYFRHDLQGLWRRYLTGWPRD